LLQASSYQVWVQAIARSFYQATWLNSLLYAADFLLTSFSATAVGIAGQWSLAGVLGHFGGLFSGLSHLWAQANVVILGWVVNSRGSCSSTDSNFTDAHPRESDRGIKFRCYWTADAAVIDVTPSEHRQKRLHSFLADSLGSGLGIWEAEKYCL